MPRIGQENVLLIGDSRREVHAALLAALPAASVTPVNDYFEGIAELSANRYTAVLAAAEPIERRPEAAVRALRDLCGDGRLILFAQPALEGLSRKMLEVGADDYVISPPGAGELQQMFGAPLLRVAAGARAAEEGHAGDGGVRVSEPAGSAELLRALPLAEIVLDALVNSPGEAPAAAVRKINELVAPAMALAYQGPGAAAPEAPEGLARLTQAVRAQGAGGGGGAVAVPGNGNQGGAAEEVAHLHLLLPAEDDPRAARHFLAQVAQLVGKVATLQERHNRMQKLAITDQLTGVYNRRYFEHFLARIIDRARTLRFPVTLLLFDLDDFKKYNDTYGHGMGDQILKETAAMMKRCCREHDLVARIGGDEFAVVFWEKEGPRLPKDLEPGKPPVPAKPPQTPQQVFERFKRQMATRQFHGLGPAGRGVLTISGGLASYPWDGRDVAELVEAADRALVMGAKQGGKDRLYLVGDDEGLGPLE